MSSLTLPTRFRAGDSLLMSASLSSYPAPTWVLEWALVKTGDQILITASASGSDHAVQYSPTITDGWEAGVYAWVAYVYREALGVKTEKYTLESGSIEILPDLEALTSGVDARSHARKVLDAINAVMENRATTDQQSYSIAGRQLVRMPIADLLALQSQYEAKVRAEESAERVNQGLPGRRRILTRLV